MKTALHPGKHSEQGSILAYFIIVVLAVTALVSVSAYVAQSARVAHRRSDMIAARQYAESGAVIASVDMSTAYSTTNQSATFPGSLTTLSTPYTLNSTLSTSAQNVYERTISSPFVNQTITAQIWVPNSASPKAGKVVASATVGDVTQSATVNLQMTFGYGAAIVSTGRGTTDPSVDKNTAKDGNVVVSGGGSGKTLIVDGGTGLAVAANGQVNIDPTATVPPGTVSKTNWSTANQIPDYTAQGTANSLFDFNRFIAVANATTNALNTATHNNHFTNLTTFIAAANAVVLTPAAALEGVIVVDIPTKTDPDFGSLDVAHLPNGINVRGTLFFNFGPSFGPLDKIINEAEMNINPANLGGLVVTNGTTYASGYPPVYYDNSKNPTNIVIAPQGYTNFVAGDDLPALMYSIGTLDIHGPANVSGVCYTPSYMEIENKKAGQTQYFKGMLIMGEGIFYENSSSGSTSIISYDRSALDNLTTTGNKGKIVSVAYWQ